MKKRLINLLLSILTILTLFPIQLVFAGENGTGGGQGETGLKGNWDGSFQGFRISIVDQEGNLMGQPLDILYNDPTATSSNMKYYWTVKTEPFESRTTANKPYKIDDLLKYLKKTSQKSKIRPMLTFPYRGQGKNVRSFLSKADQNQLPKIMNWQPDSTNYAFTFYGTAGIDYIQDETPSKTIATNGWKILVENILWMNPRSRVTGNHYSYWVYGTVSNINQWADKQRNVEGDGAFSVWGKTHSGEGDVFFRYSGICNDVGPHALELDHDEEFEGYPTILMPGLYDNQYVPFDTSDIPECASDPFHGYGVQIYSAEPSNKTHTYDQISFPPDHYKEGPAPEKPEGKYNIIKFYEQLINEEDDIHDKNAEFTHITTTERNKTVPLIKIECETHEKIAPANYEVIEWKWSDQEKPDITPDLKWTDEPIASIPALDGRCGDKCTEDESPDKQYIDITNIKEDGTKDTETVTTLYVRLRKPVEAPFTHTFNEPEYPEGDPHPAPDPTNDPDPSYPKVDPEDPHMHYRIIKVYEILEKGKPESEVETVATLLREPTVNIIEVQDEPQYKLIEWRYGTPNNEVTSSTEPWVEVTSGVPTTHSGTSEDIVNIADEENKDNVTTLYVRLRKEKLPPPEAINEDLTESQITKISNTDSATFDWHTDELFKSFIPKAVTQHSYQKHVGCSARHSHSACEGGCMDSSATCTHVTRKNPDGDDYVYATFAILDKDKHETTVANPSGHADFAGKTYGKGGEIADQIKYDKHIDDSRYDWVLSSDGSQENGVEYITTICRNSINDNVTIAKYKVDTYSAITYTRLSTLFKTDNKPAYTRRANGQYSEGIKYRLGHAEVDKIAISSCEGCGCSSHHRTFRDTKEVDYYGKTDHTFAGNFLIFVYQGDSAKTADNTASVTSGFDVKHGDIWINTNTKDAEKPKSQLFAIQQSTTIKFYPYIKMSYMITTDNIGFTGYQSFGGYTADMKSNAGRTLFILSQKQTTIKPTNAVEISWNNETTKKDNGWSIQMTSPQWAVHNRATTGVDWRQRNQVLPGGALYQLSTKDTESTIKIVTYNTLVEENNSRKWIDVSDSSKYTVHSIVENATKFLKEAEETIENFRIVQWVNKNWNAEYAWAGSASDSVKIKDGGESLANLGSQLSASTDDKYRLFDGTTENKNANESDIDIEKKAYTTIVYKGFTDVNGDVYVAWVEVKATTEKLTEAKLKEVVEFLEPLCGTHMNLGGAPSGCTYSGVKNLGNRRQDAGTIVENTRTTYVDLYQMNLKTGWLNNLIDSVERNTGYDDRATWLTPKDGKWYNEAFDGYYMVEQRALYQVGLMMPNKRVAILDPNLCTPKKNKGDIYSDDSTAFLSQFRLDEKSSVRKDKEDGYVGVWNSGDSNVTVILPNLPMMYYSRPFYIPNANVQDLS